MAKKKKGPGIWAEFKEFINRGNALMLAVGVVIGGAFSAIVTAVVNILLSLTTAALPGGLAGWVYVLPTNPAKSALKSVQETFADAKMEMSINEFLTVFKDDAAMGNSLYTKFGGKYVLSAAPVINLGALANALISFFIIAIVLFIIVKVSNSLARKRAELKAKALEAYYQKHPEERPEPEEEKEPDPTEVDYLKRITEILEAQNAPKEEPKKKGKKQKAEPQPEAKEEAPKEEAKEEPTEEPKPKKGKGKK